MTRKEALKKKKEELKELSKDVKLKKSWRKNPPEECHGSNASLRCEDGFVPGLDKKRYEYRHHHIAYCELRGRNREEIEKPADDNHPSDSYIDEIKNKILESIDEVICLSAA